MARLTDLEKAARKEWMFGDPVKAMQSLRTAGYDELARKKFLLNVVGATVTALDTDELYRDRYLDWRDEADLEDEHAHSFLVRLSIPSKIAGAVTGYSEYRQCTGCEERVPAEVVKPDGSLMTLAEYQAKAS